MHLGFIPSDLFCMTAVTRQEEDSPHVSFAEEYSVEANCNDDVQPLSADYHDLVSFLSVGTYYKVRLRCFCIVGL